MAHSMQRGTPFVKGAWLIQDPGWKLFNAMQAHAYSRRLENMQKVVGKAGGDMCFGSTHLKDFIQHCHQRGRWCVPDDLEVCRLSEGASSSAPPCAYDQYGVDIVPGRNGVAEPGLLYIRHILFGKVPPKSPGDQYVFLKPETHGTANKMDTMQHGAGLLRAKIRKWKGQQNHNSRREHPNTRHVEMFQGLVRQASRVPVRDTPLLSEHGFTISEILERGRLFGLSYMYSFVAGLAERVHLIQAGLSARPGTSRELRKQLSELSDNCAAFIGAVVQDGELDNLNVRFGEEVVLTAAELAAASFIPLTGATSVRNAT